MHRLDPKAGKKGCSSCQHLPGAAAQKIDQFATIARRMGAAREPPSPYNTKRKAEAGIQAVCSPQADANVTP